MSQTPAGWYDDPEQPGRLRYWDGTAWTEHRHDPGPTDGPAGGSGTGDAAAGTVVTPADRPPPAAAGWGATGGDAWSSAPAPSPTTRTSPATTGPATTGPVTTSRGGSGGGGRRYGLGMVIGAAGVALVIGLVGGFAIGWFTGGVSELVEAGFDEGFVEGVGESGPFQDVPGTFTADGWQFDDVELRSDSFDDFEVVADVTNVSGGPVAQVGWVVRVLDAGGGVLATLDTQEADFPAGTTRRVTFVGFDDYVDRWDTVVFEVDFQS